MDANKSYQSAEGVMIGTERRGFPDFFHCNSCGRRPGEGGGAENGNYNLAACGHIYCSGCVEKVSIHAGDIPSDQNIVCPPCKRRTRVQPIAKQLPSKCAVLFADPAELLKKSVTQMQTVMNYQNGQSRLLQQRNDYMVRQLSKKVKLDAQIISQKSRENENLKNRVAELERQVRAKQKQDEERERMNSSYRSDNTQTSRNSLVDAVNSLLRRERGGTSSISRQPSSASAAVGPSARMVQPVPSVAPRSALPAAPRKIQPLPPPQQLPPRVPYRPVRRDLRAMADNNQQLPASMRFDLSSSFNAFGTSTPAPRTTATTAATGGTGRKLQQPTMVVVPGKVTTKGPLLSQPRTRGGGMTT